MLLKDCVAELSLSDTQIAVVAFTRDGRTAALGSGGNLVQIWNMDTGKCEKIFFFDQRVSKLTMPGDSTRLECQFADGTYKKVNLTTGKIGETQKPDGRPFVSESLRKTISSMDIKDIQSVANGNAIVLTAKGEAYTWDETRKTLRICPGHRGKVTAVAICDADNRFAASYSPEKYIAGRCDGKRRALLNGEKLVRVRIVKTGQCQWRLPTNGRSIRKLQFFTSNRIILAAYATNGDILLWELINEPAPWGEKGHWERVEIVHKNQAEPLECAFPSNKKNFISAYDDGDIVISPFSNGGQQRRISTLPGIDAEVFRWKTIRCDDELKNMLDGYEH